MKSMPLVILIIFIFLENLKAEVLLPLMIPIDYMGIEIARHEVTQREWRAVMGSNDRNMNCDDCPVSDVTQKDVSEFLSKINVDTGLRFRLPSKQEWIEACLSRKITRYCGSNQASRVGWLKADRLTGTQPVGQKRPNDWGLFDMTGNASEWTSTCTETGSRRECIAMGGSWDDGLSEARPTRINRLTEAEGAGFRLVRTIDSVCLDNSKLRYRRSTTLANGSCDKTTGPRGNNWMSFIPDNSSLSTFSIPGTHDSGSYQSAIYNYPVWFTWKTQTLNLEEQLDAGVRFLDIRCRHISNKCAIHHGIIYVEQMLDSILEKVYRFLDEHPHESVIMSIKEPEYDAVDNTRSFTETLMEYVGNRPEKWYLKTNIPIMGVVSGDSNTARGKIVLVRRFDTTESIGINGYDGWPKNGTAEIGDLKVQDNFRFDKDVFGNFPHTSKWTSIQNALEEASSNPIPEKMYLNYSSATAFNVLGVPNLIDVSDKVNPIMRNYLIKHPVGQYGVVIMDYIDQDFSRRIYQSSLKFIQ
jgi:1-phosphatidylinositol phosphodiesterase